MQAARNESQRDFSRTKDLAQYPLARIAFYGPDDTSTTRLVVSILLAEDTEPIRRQWVGADILKDRRVWDEHQHFLDLYRVQAVTIGLA